ncbi:MAG TPA: hypothetical protein VFE68_05645, partial [Vicinamibacteria bacterium]|nr:hypothetical protein [Vicinamibacteria bacterium]
MDHDDSTSKPSGPPRRGRPPKGERSRNAPSAAGDSPSPEAIALEEAEAGESSAAETATPAAEASEPATAPEAAVAPAPVPVPAPEPAARVNTPAVPTVAEASGPDRLDLAALKEM